MVTAATDRPTRRPNEVFSPLIDFMIANKPVVAAPLLRPLRRMRRSRQTLRRSRHGKNVNKTHARELLDVG